MDENELFETDDQQLHTADDTEKTSQTNAEEAVAEVKEEAAPADTDNASDTESFPNTDNEKTMVIPRAEFTESNHEIPDENDDIAATKMMDAVTDSGAVKTYNAETDEYVEETRVVKKRAKSSKKKKKANHTRTMGQVFLGAIISVAAICVGAWLALQIIIGLQDFTGMSKKQYKLEVEIPEYASVDEISDILYENGLISTPGLFKLYVKLSDKGDGFRKGSFTLTPNMSYSNMVKELQTKRMPQEVIQLMIPEGWTGEQIGKLLEENYVCWEKDFEVYFKSKLNEYDFEEKVAKDSNKFYQLEGFLFPDTYEFYVIEDMKDDPNCDTMEYAKLAAEKMYQNFDSKITKSMYQRMDELGWTLNQTITMASIIQKEGIAEDTMKMVSSVFHNRLNDPFNYPCLQSDATIVYVNDYIKTRISSDSYDLYQDMFDAYNTYVAVGIPVGPICNPGIDAINAALYPDETDFYYFLTNEDGVFYYAQTADEHAQNIIDAELKNNEE